MRGGALNIGLMKTNK